MTNDINQKYLSEIILYFKNNIDKVVPLSVVTKTPKQYIHHVKYYIDHRPLDYPEVYFNDNFTKIFIHVDCRYIKWNIPAKEPRRSNPESRQVVRNELPLPEKKGNKHNNSSRSERRPPTNTDQWQLRFDN